jgi:hypothetical protein
MRLLACASLLMAACLTAAPPPPEDPSRFQSRLARRDWLSEFRPRPKGRFGLDNLSIEEEPGQPFERFIRARYPAGSSSPRGSRAEGKPLGGGQFMGTLATGPVDRLFLRYFVRFPADFDFVKGGKLPGLYGGSEVSGGRIPDGTNGFSTRIMWRTAGQGELYAYMPSSDTWGTSLGRGSFSFPRGRWTCVEQEVVLNTPGVADGTVRIWIDDQSALEQAGLLFRTASSLRIEGIFFSTFYGGGDGSWAPRSDAHADFAGFATAPSRIGCGQSGAQQPTAELPDVYLPDFSYAGYHHGEAPPVAQGELLRVTDFGATANDESDDSAAFLRALDAARRHDGPVVVLVPRGRYVLRQYLFLERSGLVLRGEGSGPDGSVLYFPEPLESLKLPAELAAVKDYLARENKRTERGEPFSPFSWSGGFVWSRLPVQLAARPLSSVVAGRRGARAIDVASADGLAPGQIVELAWYNREGDGGSLLRHVYGLDAGPFGARLWQHPDEPVVTQPLRIERIEGRTVQLAEPLLHDVDARWTPLLREARYLEEVGIEHLRVEFPERAYGGHHREAGFNAFHLHDLYDGWVDDVSVVHADSALLTDHCAQLGVRNLRVEGRGGHYGIHLGDVYGVLVEDFRVDAPSEHPISFNTHSRGSVFTRGVLAEARFDQHRGVNHQNLFDDLAGSMRSGARPFEHGGASYWGPTHGAFNTFWNIRLTLPAAQAPVDLGGVDDAGPARLVGVRANVPIRIKYPRAYVDPTSERVERIPSLYRYQRARRARTDQRS